MKYVLLLSISLILFSCGKTDTEAIKGEWKVESVYMKGKLSFSTDKSKTKEIVDNIVAMQKEMFKDMMSEDQLRKMVEEQIAKDMKDSKESKFTFNDKELTISGMSGGKKEEALKYTINEKTKTLTINSPKDPKVEMKYAFDGDKLKLTSEQIGFDLVK